MSKRVLGVIGGSGVYDIDGLEMADWLEVDTPWGPPSDQVHVGILDGIKVCFLPRHGRGHRHSPSTINYRANIDALKRLGVTDVLSLSAVGSLREDTPPGHFVLVDQFVDRTFARERSFFGAGCVAHVSMAHPVSSWLSGLAGDACESLGLPHRRGGTYVVIEGPQFSTLAESKLYRAWGCDVVGMTNMPEAKLAREAELRYATIAMVTDFDCWHPDHDAVTVDAVIRTAGANAANARALVRAIAGLVKTPRREPDCGCERALDHAIMTLPQARDPVVLARLDAVAGRLL